MEGTQTRRGGEARLDVTVRSDGCDAEEERATSTVEIVGGVVEKAIGLFGEYVDGVLPFVTHRWIAVALEGGIEVGVGIGVQEEVGAVPAG